MNIRLFGRVIFISKPVFYTLAVFLAILTILVGKYLLDYNNNEGLAISDIKDTMSQPPSETFASAGIDTEKIFIYIVGAVKNPGLYEVDKKSLVYDVVSAAGGVLPDADSGNINMALELNENLMLKILTEKERTKQERESSLVIITDNSTDPGNKSGDTSQNQQQNRGKININTAVKNELVTLPGIGEKRAQDIIDYRQNNGKFKTIEDIMLVSGIKEAVFNSIKDLITV